MDEKMQSSERDKKPFDQQKYKNEFNKKSYDEINVRFPRGTKEQLQRIADERGESIPKIIKSAIESTYNIKCTKDGE